MGTYAWSTIVGPGGGLLASVTQGTIPWIDNITQFGSNPVVTGIGPSGLGIPRVSVSNDSTILCVQAGSWAIDVNNFPATQAVTQSGIWNLNNISGTISLPTGAATSANQTLVQSVAGTSATQAVTIQGDALGVPVPISGAVTITPSGLQNVNLTQFGSNAVVTGTGISGVGIPRVTVANDSNILATQSGTWDITNISGTVSLPTGAATSALQSAVQSAPGASAGTAITVQGSATGVPLPVSGTISGTVSNNITEFGSNAVQTGTGASGVGIPRVTVANDSNILATQSGVWSTGRTWNLSSITDSATVNLSSVGGVAVTQGQKAMAASIPVVIASDQSAYPVTMGQALTAQPAAYTTGTQQPVSLDAYGLQMSMTMGPALAGWGKLFSVTTQSVNTASASEAAFLHINNPNGSGVTAKFRWIEYGISQASADILEWRLYKAPTVTVNGSAITPVGMRQTSQATAQVQFFTLPTTSSFGTIMQFFRAVTGSGGTANKVDYNFELILEPNNKYLITVVQAGTGANKAGYVTLEYSEQ